nr:aldehyde dehydrogenase family protein [Sulfurimonas sp. MAG313]
MNNITVTAPYDGRILAEIPLQSMQEVNAVLALAKDTYDNPDKWLSKYKRVEILEKTMQIMSSKIEELTLIAANEGGKPYSDSKVEVLRAINGVKIAIEHLAVFEGHEVAMGHTLSSANRMAYTMKEPIGVVLAISAFNHPLNLAVHQVIPAIAVGSPVIIRPSASTPMSAIKLLEILYEAGLPKGFAQVIVCDRQSAEALVTSDKIDFFKLYRFRRSRLALKFYCGTWNKSRLRTWGRGSCDC